MISTSSKIMGGTPVFIGTRVPVQTLFDYLEAGESIDDFLEGFPTVTKEQVIALLEEARKQLIDMVAVEALGQNEEFMEFLAPRSRSTKRLSLEEAQKRLGI